MTRRVAGGLLTLFGFSIINGMPEDRTMVLWIPVGCLVFMAGLMLLFGGEKENENR